MPGNDVSSGVSTLHVGGRPQASTAEDTPSSPRKHVVGTPLAPSGSTHSSIIGSTARKHHTSSRHRAQAAEAGEE